MATQVGAPTVPIYLAGEFVEAGTPLEVRNPATDELVATTFQAGPAELERAVVAAVEGFAQTRHLASYERRDALAHVAERIAEEADELAELLTRESGKPIRDARGEVARASLTFRTAAEQLPARIPSGLGTRPRATQDLGSRLNPVWGEGRSCPRGSSGRRRRCTSRPPSRSMRVT